MSPKKLHSLNREEKPIKWATIVLYYTAGLNNSPIGAVVAVASEIQYTLREDMSLQNPLSNRPLLNSTKATSFHVCLNASVYTV